MDDRFIFGNNQSQENVPWRFSPPLNDASLKANEVFPSITTADSETRMAPAEHEGNYMISFWNAPQKFVRSSQILPPIDYSHLQSSFRIKMLINRARGRTHQVWCFRLRVWVPRATCLIQTM